MKRAMIYGVYDLTHYGHYRQFKALKTRGYEVNVGVVTDKFAESYKRKPVMNQYERLENIEHCKWVDRAFISGGTRVFKEEIEDYNIDVIVHGSDWSDEDYKKHMKFPDQWIARHGLQILTLPYTEGVSTSNLIERIKE